MVNEVNSIGRGLPNSTRQTDDSAGSARTTGNSNAPGTESPVGSQSPATGDTVNLSSEAQDIARIQRALAQLPDIDEARVQEIRNQIESGTYSIDVEALADRILADDRFFDS